MKRFLLPIVCVVVGVILGVVLVLLVLGSPKPPPLPGVALKAPDPNGDPPGTAIVTLDENFFNSLLGSIFNDLGGPKFPLELTRMERDRTNEAGERMIPAAVSNDCQDAVVLVKEDGSVKTGVRFADGKIVAPLAFTGSKSIFGACVNFKGWAQASIQLSFDQSKQTVYGQINVEGVTLEDAPAFVSSIATRLVQYSINRNINPLEILNAPHLAIAMPVKSANGTLEAIVKDVRAEIANGKLILHITYGFTGVRVGGPPQS